MVGLGSIAGGALGGAGVVIAIQAVDQYSSQFKRATTTLQKFKGVAKLVAGAVVVGMAAIGIASLKSAADFEVTKKSFEVMLGSAEKGQKMLKDLAEFTKATPFQLKELETSSRMLLGMGIEADKVIPTMKSLGDVAAGLGIEFDRVALNFGQVKSQGRLMGTELRDFSRAGIPIIAELAKNLNVAESEIKDMASAGEISFAMVEEAFATMSGAGGQFADLMKQQMDTAKGQISNLQDAMEQTKREIGEGLLPAFKELTATLDENKEAIGEVAGVLGKGFSIALKGALKLIQEGIELGDKLAISLQYAAEAFTIMNEAGNPFTKMKKLAELETSAKQERKLAGMGITPEQRSQMSEGQKGQISGGELDKGTIQEMLEVNARANELKIEEKDIINNEVSPAVENLITNFSSLKTTTTDLNELLLKTLETGQTLKGEEMATVFGTAEEGLIKLIDAQRKKTNTEDELNKLFEEGSIGLIEFNAKMDDTEFQFLKVQEAAFSAGVGANFMKEAVEEVGETFKKTGEELALQKFGFKSMEQAFNNKGSSSGGFVKTGAEAFAINSAALDRAERAASSASAQAQQDANRAELGLGPASSGNQELGVDAYGNRITSNQVAVGTGVSSSGGTTTIMVLADSRNIEQNVGADLATQTGVTG